MTDVATTSSIAAGSLPAAPATPQKLDDLMLAMDVVDTLRHQENLALRELDGDARKAALVARLKTLYAAQGIEVSDEILEEGVRSLEETRFSYEPAPSGLARTLALMWIDRGRFGAILAGVVLAVAIGVGSYSYFVVGGARRATEAARVEITQTLPAALAKARAAAADEAKSAAAVARLGEIAAIGAAAVERGDAGAAKAAIGDFERLTAVLRQTWEIRIVSRPGVRSGVWRVPSGKSVRNYYLIVEQIGPDGRAMERSVRSEETQATKTVTLWGQRVPQATFERVAADKQDDGIIQNVRLGEKRRGDLEVRWAMPVETGAITEW